MEEELEGSNMETDQLLYEAEHCQSSVPEQGDPGTAGQETHRDVEGGPGGQRLFQLFLKWSNPVSVKQKT